MQPAQDDLESVARHYPPVAGMGQNGVEVDEIIYDCGHPHLCIVCKKEAPFVPLPDSLIRDKSQVMPLTLLSGNFLDRDDEILHNVVRTFKSFWSRFWADPKLGKVVFVMQSHWGEIMFNMFVRFARQLISMCESNIRTDINTAFYIDLL